MMDTSPKLSIIVPTYNRASTYLSATIQSALSQSYADFELFIVDDHSTDNTEEIVKSFMTHDPRVRYFKAPVNYGEYWVTNYGMSNSKGTYVTWLHSDDLLPVGSLERRMGALEADSTLDFVHGAITKINEKSEPFETLQATDSTANDLYRTYVGKLIEGNMEYQIHHTTVMMKRSFFYRTGPFDCSLPFAGDIDWLVRALRIGKFQKVPDVLYLYRKHQGARTVTDLKEGVDKIQVRKMIAQRYL